MHATLTSSRGKAADHSALLDTVPASFQANKVTRLSIFFHPCTLFDFMSID